MDELYSDLENYDEQNIISELQTENKELKQKLEEYAENLNKLQKDFDNLSSEYKKLELNYSSLLKTAKAEIERKTQMITNLNLEKDRMVLKCYGNKNVSGYKGKEISSPQQNKGKGNKDSDKSKSDVDKRMSHYSSTQRKDTNLSTNTATATDLRNRLLSLSNTVPQNLQTTERNTEAKENVMQEKILDEDVKSRASIKNRRKSMPAFSRENEDNDEIRTRDTLRNPKIQTDYNTQEKQKFPSDRYERSKSRVSETSSLEDRKLGHHEISDNHRQRQSRYDKPPNDRYSARHQSSHRYRRDSPYRYPDSRDYRPDKYISRESPPRNKYQKYRDGESREKQFDRHLPTHDRKTRGREVYSTKRRTEQCHNEVDFKRAKVDPMIKHDPIRVQSTENVKCADKVYVAEPLEIQFNSCESPDYDSLEARREKTPEIRSTSTSKLEDPRLSSEKYFSKVENGKKVLLAKSGYNVDIIMLNKNGYGSDPIAMPEALLKMPALDAGQAIIDIYKGKDNIADVSLESGEIGEDDCSDEITKNTRVSSTEYKETSVTLPALEKPRNIESSSKHVSNYKIPKKHTNPEAKQNVKNDKPNPTTEIRQQTSSSKQKNSEDIKHIDIAKQPLQTAHTIHLNTQSTNLSNTRIPFLDSSEQKTLTAKDVVQVDLEMSDDCDDDEVNGVTKNTSTNEKLEKNQLDKVDSKSQAKSNGGNVTRLDTSKQIVANESKKSKTKKKPKQKDGKDGDKSEEPIKHLEKPAKAKEKSATHIKTKFSELFGDSSSLIHPEDLGLPVPALTTRLPDQCVPFFEDAVDATDVNTIKSSVALNIPKGENKPNSGDKILSIGDPACQVDDTVVTMNKLPTLDDDVKNIYKNLEPSVTDPEENVKTVVISCGVQPSVSFGNEQQHIVSSAPLLKLNDDVKIKALATSTPHKPWQPHADTSAAEQRETSHSQISRDGTTADKSDANTMDSQTSDSNIPDIRIFVKRRRKFKK